jgi:uncharacterized membrane protein
MILRGVFSIASAPILWIQQKIDGKPIIHKFRIDMIFSGFLSAFFSIYFLTYIEKKISIGLNTQMIIISTVLISIFDLYNWNKNNPFWYETCLNIPPALGYIFAIIYFVN